MEKFIMKYTLQDILVFFIMFAIAIKELVTFFDWSISRVKQAMHKDQRVQTVDQKLEKQIKQIEHDKGEIEQQIIQLKQGDQQIKQMIRDINDRTNILIQSDKDSIKSWITKQYHYFMRLGYIDNYSLDCLEKRFGHYKDENGNSFIGQLMQELENLPKQI